MRKEWTKAPLQKRRAHVELLLESLEHKDVEIRFTNARRLLYILQGTFAETTSPEHQLHWIFENCKVVRDANGLSNIVEAMKIASSKHDFLWLLSDTEAARIQLGIEERSDLMEEITTEISVYLAMLYHLIEVFKGHDDFADELSKPHITSNSKLARTSSSEHGPTTAGLFFQCSVWSSR